MSYQTIQTQIRKNAHVVVHTFYTKSGAGSIGVACKDAADAAAEMDLFGGNVSRETVDRSRAPHGGISGQSEHHENGILQTCREWEIK